MIRRRAASHQEKQIAEWFEQETGRHLAQDPEPDRQKVPQVSADEAIDMFEGLCWHESQQEDGIMEVIQVLQLQKQLMLRKANKAWGAKESNNQGLD